MISILCPTRNRPEWVKRMWTSAAETAVGEIEFCFYFDNDDPTAGEVVEEFTSQGLHGSGVRGERIVLSEMWNKAFDLADGDILMHAGDDLIFRTQGWDKAVADAFPSDRIAFVYGRDGYQDEKLGTHGFVSREWVEAVGYFVPPYFSSDYNDLWLNEVAAKIGRRVFLPEVLIEHMHPDAGKAEWDQTHRERLERHRNDLPGELYRDLAAEREMDAQRLRAVMS